MRKIVLFTLLLTNCTDDQSNLETILIKDESCWAFYRYPDEQKDNAVIGGCNKFYASGTFDALIVSEGKLTKTFSLDIDAEEDNTWEFNENDSIFDVGGQKFRIIKYGNDTIVMKNESDHIQKLTSKAGRITKLSDKVCQAVRMALAYPTWLHADRSSLFVCAHGLEAL